MDPFGVEFSKTIGQLVGEYRATFAWVALVWHLCTLALLYLILRYGNRYRRVFAAYFAINYVWLVAFVGIWMSVGLYERMGMLRIRGLTSTSETSRSGACSWPCPCLLGASGARPTSSGCA